MGSMVLQVAIIIVSAGLVQVLPATTPSDVRLERTLAYASALSMESVADYATGESVSFPDTLFSARMSTLGNASLSSSEITAWQGHLLAIVKKSDLEEIPLGPDSIIVGCTTSPYDRQFSLRKSALNALFDISDSANDPGLEDAYEDTSVSLEMRHEIWQRLVDEWGMTTLADPVSP